MASFITAVLMITALNGLQAIIESSRQATHHGQAVLLAQELMGEILRLPYEDPDGSPVFGPEPGEGTSTRADFDDVDDYHGWTASPPQRKDGTPLTDLAGWRRTVNVTYADAATGLATVGSDEGVKAVEVVVSYQGQELARLRGVQTRAWIDTVPDPANDRTTGSLSPKNHAPVAVAEASPVNTTVGSPISFNGTTSFDRDGDPLTYHWDFGNGATSYGAITSYAYNAAGTYQVTLTVTDVWGATGTSVVSINVSD